MDLDGHRLILIDFDGFLLAFSCFFHGFCSIPLTFRHRNGFFLMRQAELQTVQDNVGKLLAEFDTAKKKKDDLQQQFEAAFSCC